MKKIIKIFAFAAVLFVAAGTAGLFSQLTPYNICRCKQSSPNISDATNICCQSLAAGNLTYASYNVSSCCGQEAGGYGTSNGDARCCPSGGTWNASTRTCVTATATIKINSVNWPSTVAGYSTVTGTTPNTLPNADCSSSGASCVTSFNNAYPNKCSGSYSNGQSCTASTFYPPQGNCIQGTYTVTSAIADSRCGNVNGAYCNPTGTGAGTCSSCGTVVYAKYNCLCIVSGNVISCS